jgi:AcrR family transcriptional regulator
VGRPREHNEQTRTALLHAAERLVAEGGPDGLSVRAVASAAGTTTQAVYSLFGSKDGLVAALAQVAFELLYERVDQVPQTADPADDLVTIGLEVFRPFVREHPALYRLAFQRIVGLRPHPGLARARERAFTQLQQRLQRAQDAGQLATKSARYATLELIAMFEGLANAELRGGTLATIPPGEEERAWRDALETLVRGFRSS